MGFFRKPFKLLAIDADTGKPLDPNVRRKTYVKYYDIKPSGSGSKSFVAYKAPSDQAKKVEITTEDVKKDKNGKGKGKTGGDEGKKNEGGGKQQQQQKGADEAWTTEEDEKLKAMKAEGKTWNEISAEIGRPKGHCTSRWKEIGRTAGGNDNQKNKQNEDGGQKGKAGGAGEQKQNQNQNAGNNNQGEGKKGKENKGGNENNPKDQNQQPKNAESKKTKPASNQGGKAPSETLLTMHDWQTLQEDDLFSFGELQCLSELIAKDSEQSWERIAARFFDLTGRRVHWEDVRDKFEGMAWAAYKASK